MSSSNIYYCFLFCLTSKVDLTFFIYIIDTSCKEPLSPLRGSLTSGILIYFLYRTFLPIFCRFSRFFLLNEKKVSLCMHRPIIDTPHNRLKFILKGHSYFYILTHAKYFFDFLTTVRPLITWSLTKHVLA